MNQRSKYIEHMAALPFEDWWKHLENPESQLWKHVFDDGDEMLVLDIGRIRQLRGAKDDVRNQL